MMRVLAVETSCDDTSVAIVRENGFVENHLVVSQNAIHQPYGGIVPELASRNHLYHLLPLVDQVLNDSSTTWKDISGLVTTNRPGLIGSLMVGLVTVKTLSLVCKKPYAVANHVEGHLLSPFLWDKDHPMLQAPFPCLALIVSGAHTHLFIIKEIGKYCLIGRTIDDAAGEALDKFATLLGLKYPGGAEIDKLAQLVPVGRYPFPKVQLKTSPLNFSFSGLKTAGFRLVQKVKKQGTQVLKQQSPYLCADYQHAIVDHILSRLELAIKSFSVRSVVLVGGVSANSYLRKQADSWARSHALPLVLPYKHYCTDNAAMIALVGHRLFLKGQTSSQDMNCYPYSLPDDFEQQVS